ATIEALGQILEDWPRGTFLARDELGAWLTSFQRYKGAKGGSDLHHWLEAFHGRPWKIDRKTGDRKTLYIPRPVVSVTGGLTPGILARCISEEFLDAGLVARLLLVMPDKKRKRWSGLYVDPATEQAYDNLIGTLLDLEGDEDDDGDVSPLAVEFSQDALA